MATPWSIPDSSVLFALQADLSTPNTTDGDFVAIACDKLVPKLATEVIEFELLTGQAGAEPERIPGRRSGTITVSMPLETFKDGYDSTAENPGGVPVGGIEVVPPWFCIYGNVLGSHIDGINTGDPLSTQNTNFWRGAHLSNNERTTNGVTAAGTDSTHIVVDNAPASDKIKAGELVVAALGDTSAPQLGYVKTKAVQTLTLFDPSVNVAANNAAHIYGTSTAWVSDEQQRPLTMRWTGQGNNQCYELTGVMFKTAKQGLDSGGVPTIELSGEFVDYRIRKADGGLVVPDVYERAPSLIGAHYGILQIDSVDTCDLEAVTCEFTSEFRYGKCHSAAQGIESITVLKKRVRFNFSIGHDNADAVYDAAGAPATEGSHLWQSKLELGTLLTIGCYVGPRPGRIFAQLVASARIIAVPDASDRDGVLAYSIQTAASTYSGDTTDTAETSADAPIDSPYRCSLA